MSEIGILRQLAFLPVIVAMDSNAQAFPLPQDPTYTDFIEAGYSDVWQELFPADPGLTCCQNESDNKPESELYQRIDLILTLGRVEGQKHQTRRRGSEHFSVFTWAKISRKQHFERPRERYGAELPT